MDRGVGCVSGDASPRGSAWRTQLALYAAVTAGSVAGTVLRWAVSMAAASWLAGPFPWGTLFANASGSLAIGFFARLSAPDGRLFAGPRLRHFVMTGLCGGYTTFSVLSLETLRLAQQGAILSAALYALVSLAAALIAVWIGDAAAARFNRLKGAAP
jgi:CrcB protein